MSEKRPTKFQELEARLRDLGGHTRFPAEVDLTRRVRNVLEQPSRRPLRRRWWRPQLALGLASLVAVMTVAMLISPRLREAVADFLGVAGIEIEFGERDTLPPPGGRLALGRRVSLLAVEDEVAFEVRAPDSELVGEPDAAYVAPLPEGGSLSFVYSDDSLPKTSETGVGMLLTQFRGDLEPTLLKKVVSPGTTVRAVSLGDEGYWISGAPHTVLYLDANGDLRESVGRLAGDTLVWEEEGVTYRLESALTLPEVLEIARSLR